MSRIGRAPIQIPSGATVKTEGRRVDVEGPKGNLSLTLPELIRVKVENATLHVERDREGKRAKAFHGLYRALLANMVLGVTAGFERELQVVGIGYRAQVKGAILSLSVGLSHPVELAIPNGVTVETPKPTQILIKGSDKYLVGQFAATVRQTAPPEPYKGTGIKYAGEVIRRKAGKTATGTKSA